MKSINLFILGSALTLFASCSSSSDSTNEETNAGLVKRVIFNTQSLYPDSNTKEIQHYANNQIVADTIFNNLNQWTARKVITTNGGTKTYQTLDTNDQIVAHREETYDNQDRVTSRRTYVPLNLIVVNFTYNPDNTVTANAYNTLYQTTTLIATYHKNSDGIIYKEFRPMTSQPSVIVESTLQFEGSKPVSLINSVNSSVISFDYYPNAMPADIQKSVTELNNKILLGLSLTKLAEEGNFYYKRASGTLDGVTSTYQTDFNIDNYLEYFKSTYVHATINNLLTTEIFYYYN
jgi:hypothetical protein